MQFEWAEVVTEIEVSSLLWSRMFDSLCHGPVTIPSQPRSHHQSPPNSTSEKIVLWEKETGNLATG